ncbi:TerB family tellurite resistance protein [uncultured Nitratireductor sp.]|uniref:TerB family tellurite resistance protein n=1 Tax=uncultured Nitratireductor sp. TaxID=520953 RepID=UPI0025CE87EE|nr:TerB family tellurite resistance protein [uncultured Nitratireductor sp.]
MFASPDSGGSMQGGAMPAAMNAMTAEVLMLLRLAMTDEPLGQREMAVLRRAATDFIKVPDEEIEQLVASLAAVETDSDVMQARLGMRQGSHERRLILAETLFELGRRDPELAPRLGRLSARVCDVLGLSADEVAHLSS